MTMSGTLAVTPKSTFDRLLSSHPPQSRQWPYFKTFLSFWTQDYPSRSLDHFHNLVDRFLYIHSDPLRFLHTRLL
jgi:hypothetical protein